MVSRTSRTMAVEGESLEGGLRTETCATKGPFLLPCLNHKGQLLTGCSVFGIDDIHELWLERSATNKEAIHIMLRGQLLTVAASDRTSIDNPS